MLPNYICKEDLVNRLPVQYFRNSSIPIAIKRIDKYWCEFVQIFRTKNNNFDGPIGKIYLPKENQLKSVNELLEEYCEENDIPFVNMV